MNSCDVSTSLTFLPPQGKPAVVQVRRLDKEFSIVVNKTFFKSDSAKFNWNIKGESIYLKSLICDKYALVLLIVYDKRVV